MHSEVRSEARKQQAWVEDNVDEVDKADKTKQNAEYAPTINTCINIIENKVDEKIAKKDKVEKADETKQNTEYTLTTNTCVHILKNKIPNKFAKVWSRDKSEELAVESRTLETPTLTALKNMKNKPAESKKIAVEFIFSKQV
jgi:tRNA U34 5-carboxymethylaminomethyl modifying GTPase MnmE/TrmE